MLEKARKAVTPEMEDALRTELAPLKPSIVAFTLQSWRPLAIKLAETKNARELKVLIDSHAATKPHWALYAQAAWIARALALAEYLERSDLAMQPRQWAGGVALRLLDEFEGDTAWLWPFESESPWPSEDDWDEDEEA
jgi:hypothetical protein